MPGRKLDGVIITSVGLPQINEQNEVIRDWYQKNNGQGFLFAYAIPGMQKVAQAGGRVIRSETDRGVVILLDDRYDQSMYRRLLPDHWKVENGSFEKKLKEFWYE